MQISTISPNNFGATPDIATRNLLKRASLKGVDTRDIEDVMKDIYADKYIMTHTDLHNNTHIDLCDKEEGVSSLFSKLLIFNSKDISERQVMASLHNILLNLAKNRSKAQRAIDRIENKFGRYDEPNAYKHGNYYLDN